MILHENLQDLATSADTQQSIDLRQNRLIFMTPKNTHTAHKTEQTDGQDVHENVSMKWSRYLQLSGLVKTTKLCSVCSRSPNAWSASSGSAAHCIRRKLLTVIRFRIFTHPALRSSQNTMDLSVSLSFVNFPNENPSIHSPRLHPNFYSPKQQSQFPFPLPATAQRANLWNSKLFATWKLVPF